MLTHTSGFSYEILDRNSCWRPCRRGTFSSVFADPIGGFQAPWVFEPGEAWSYGIGIDIAGQILETASGKKLGAILAEQIFAPLGMTRTSFNPDAKGMAKVQVAAGDALQGLPLAPQHPSGGAGLFSTLEDYGRFLRALLGGGALDGERILREAMVARLGQNQIAPLTVTPMASVLPPMSQDLDMGFGSEASWGYGFVCHEGPGNNGCQAGSLRWGGLFNRYLWIDPTAGLAGVWATQRLPFCHPAAIAGLEAFERAAYGA
jgi:Beta-lactamase class C and other penicillin binding proteins